MENLSHKGVFYLTKKRITALFSGYIIALVLVLSGFIYSNYRTAQTYKLYINNSYQHAFAEVVSSLGSIDSSLQKSLYVSSPKMISSVCSEIFAKSTAAQMSMGELPFTSNELEHTASFITKVGDYAYSLAKNAYLKTDGGYTEEEFKNLKALSDGASVLSQNLTELYADINAGKITISDLNRSQNALSSSEDNIVPTDLAGSFKLMESEFPEIPSLIYDGPFSEHIEKMSPKLIENEPEITEEEALIKASKFLGTDKSRITLLGVRDDNLPVYILQIPTKGGNAIAEVTKQGGKMLNFVNSRNVDSSNISSDDAVKIAKRFLEAHGYNFMAETYWQISGNTITINFAYAENNVICYPDLVKVRIALDNGEVINFESLGYIMNHIKRDIPNFAVTEKDAASAVSSKLNILSHEMSLIPTSGKNEVYCHEFKCENEDEKHYIVYINADTGIEENILILIENENGNLTL